MSTYDTKNAQFSGVALSSVDGGCGKCTRIRDINGVTAELVQWDCAPGRGVLFAFVKARRTPFAK